MPQSTLYLAWGNGGQLRRSGEILNNARRLTGLEQLEMFMEAGLLVPRFTSDIEEAKKWVVKDTLITLGRKLNHTQGRDIRSPNQRDWEKSDYWVLLIPDVKHEWRFHIFKDKSIHRQLKVYTDDTRPWNFIRNRRTGWTFTRQRPEGYTQTQLQKLRDVAKTAVRACNYDFGAVDLVEDQTGNVYVLEVNQAPGLDNKTASCYAKAAYDYFRRNT